MGSGRILKGATKAGLATGADGRHFGHAMTASNHTASPGESPDAGQAQNPAAGASIDADEVARFSALADTWWDPRGPFAPLHKLNPARLAFITARAAEHFGRDARTSEPFAGLRLLDIGCGGGLLSEPMARLGFQVTAIDASEKNIGTARAHAARMGLCIGYRPATVEQLVEEGAGPFDLILNMEVVEHVADPKAYLLDSARLLAPGGLMIVSTLNRTLKALALAKIGAEYVLRWLPAGTHDWRKFLTPDEIRLMLSEAPVGVEGPFGLTYNPLTDRWRESADADVNYMMLVRRPA